MLPPLRPLVHALSRAVLWLAVLYLPFEFWELADRYLRSICGPRSSFGGNCSTPGLGHYYALLSANTMAAALLVPLGTFKLAVCVRDGWRALRRRSP